MSNRRNLSAVAVLALVLVASFAARAWAATTTGTTFQLAGRVPPIRYTVDAATTGDVVVTDTGALSPTKRSHITRRVAGGVTQYVMTRLQIAPNGLWFDEIAAATTTALASRISTFDLSTASPGHPSPTHDAVDDAAAALMIGYTGL